MSMNSSKKRPAEAVDGKFAKCFCQFEETRDDCPMVMKD
jgi:hypothetical protein